MLTERKFFRTLNAKAKFLEPTAEFILVEEVDDAGFQVSFCQKYRLLTESGVVQHVVANPVRERGESGMRKAIDLEGRIGDEKMADNTRLPG
ncbi:hypothetical protein Tasa_048_045 [Tanticharoenia sakaeratensis NBRC 103193]|uniref:Uncharacterized protein n=1 Tax=Tanticharoenia sakaeratensis NBRC 103193 TaxID=1231623 RepID=A0A0D6MPV8_9PROT|nr:hypothetical protein Tasa_048_045 [Tanticharoenia sakaeratensis NBRC 103193]GBQ22116.1 hypothetical protein AA103193_1964 [Tanticharoenia sakaeratensis NBRC 103193]